MSERGNYENGKEMIFMANSSKIYYTAQEVAEMLNVSRSSAYTIVKNLNGELKAQGYLTIPGKVSVMYFNHKWYGLAIPSEQQVV